MEVYSPKRALDDAAFPIFISPAIFLFAVKVDSLQEVQRLFVIDLSRLIEKSLETKQITY